MSEQSGGEMMPDYITKSDLKESTDDIKEYIADCLKPVNKIQSDHEIILTGPSKRNGLVGDLRSIQTKMKVIYSLLVFIGAGFVKTIFF